MTPPVTKLTEAERAALQELDALGLPLTHEEIGERLGLSHASVRRIEKKALAKMRKAARWTPRGKE